MRLRRSTVWAEIAVGVTLAAIPASADASEASCYGPGLFGNRTASGSTLRESTVGVAHRHLSFNTVLYVRTGNRTIAVRVIDRGPFVPGRHLDLTQAAVRRLGFAGCAAWGHRSVTSWRKR